MTKLKYMLMLPLVILSISVMAQDSRTEEQNRKAREDSISRVEQKSSDKLSDLKRGRDETKVKADKAQKVERNANNAARSSKLAYRSEQKAQKSRNKADKQARRASKVRTTSDN